MKREIVYRKIWIWVVVSALAFGTVAGICQIVRCSLSNSGKLIWFLLDLQNKRMVFLQEEYGKEYQDGVEMEFPELEEDVRKQLEVFARHWHEIEYCTEYTVYDLDKDGKLEVITTHCEGTGRFSANHFYQVNDALDGIVELEQDHYSASDGEFDLGWSLGSSQFEEAYESGGKIYYPATDYIRGGTEWYALIEGAYYLKDGIVYNVTYCMQEHSYTFDELLGIMEESIYYDVENIEKKEISVEECEEKKATFWSGKTAVEYWMEWCSYDDLCKAEQDEIFSILAECYRNGK